MELISLVRPEHGNTLSRRLRPRGWYKSVIDSEHHDFCTLPRLSFKSQMQTLQLLVTHGSWVLPSRTIVHSVNAELRAPSLKFGHADQS